MMAMPTASKRARIMAMLMIAAVRLGALGEDEQEESEGGHGQSG